MYGACVNRAISYIWIGAAIFKGFLLFAFEHVEKVEAVVICLLFGILFNLRELIEKDE